MAELEIKTEDDFRNLMEEIDAKLTADGVAIHARSLHAKGAVCDRYGIDLVQLERHEPPVPGAYAAEDLSWRISNWYDERYGARQKISLSPGTTIVDIRGDLYRVKIPGILGTVQFICDPQLHGKVDYSSLRTDVPPAYNVLDAIEGLTPGYSQSLSYQELKYLWHQIYKATLAFQEIQMVYRLGFAEEAKGDLHASVDYLFHIPPQYGLSRWSSLQAVEKFLKTHLSEKGMTFPKNKDGHNLHKLANLASGIGYGGLPNTLLDIVQCSAGVRYGEFPSTKGQALRAHKAAVTICWRVAKSVC